MLLLPPDQLTVPPQPDADNITSFPEHIVVLLAEILGAEGGTQAGSFTGMVMEASPLSQPFDSLHLALYVVVLLG